MTGLAFPWLIAIPLISSPVVYLAGRLVILNKSFQNRQWLIHVLAFLAI